MDTGLTPDGSNEETSMQQPLTGVWVELREQKGTRDSRAERQWVARMLEGQERSVLVSPS